MIVEGGCTNPGWPRRDGGYGGGDERPTRDGWRKRLYAWLGFDGAKGQPPVDAPKDPT